MAIVKDWATDAATEIAAGIVLDAEITNSRDGIRSIIVKHCPIQEDVVYMPVPRCETCKHWERDFASINGSCVLTQGQDSDGYEPPHPSKASASVGGDEFGTPVLLTTSDFGCVQWEQK